MCNIECLECSEGNLCVILCVQNVQKATNVFAQKHTVSRDKRGAVLGNEGAGFR